ncbi:MAG: hypothetical protein H6871_07980 [Methylobacteriaceae bacterium]|nr:hypothetical protein [Methylobacteriaceae bacterium]
MSGRSGPLPQRANYTFIIWGGMHGLYLLAGAHVARARRRDRDRACAHFAPGA